MYTFFDLAGLLTQCLDSIDYKKCMFYIYIVYNLCHFISTFLKKAACRQDIEIVLQLTAVRYIKCVVV